MFSTKLSRAAHRATTGHTSAAAISATTSTACLSTRAQHQRRPSSSKASCPPDNNATKPAPAAKTDVAEAQGAQSSGRPSQQKSSKSRTRGPYRRVGAASNGTTASNKQVAAEPVDQFAGLPSVPNLQGLDAKDLLLSTFFSMHRPISVTTSIPPPASPEAFNTLFSSHRQRIAENPWENGNSAERRPEDVIYTLHQTIENLENGARSAEDDGVRWEVIHESPTNASESVKHLDGMPKMKTLDELVSQFKPFRAPPPPQPFPDAADHGRKATNKASTRSRPRQKTFTTTITVTESTYDDGQKTYSASSSPIVRLPDATEQAHGEATDIREPRSRQPFLTRMYRRRRLQASTFPQSRAGLVQIRRREPSDARQERIQKMFLISVKRQRKLKMKKHKYKKLMKRTRNLRRKLDRN